MVTPPNIFCVSQSMSCLNSSVPGGGSFFMFLKNSVLFISIFPALSFPYTVGLMNHRPSITTESLGEDPFPFPHLLQPRQGFDIPFSRIFKSLTHFHFPCILGGTVPEPLASFLASSFSLSLSTTSNRAR